MKKIILAITIVVATLISCKENKKNKVEAKKEVKTKETLSVINNIDTKASTLTWKGTKIGEAHNGTVALKEGFFIVESGMLKSGKFTMDMSTIICSDLEEGDGKEKLEGHLKSVDFFDVAKYPTVTFVITEVNPKDGKLDITGNLTIKDVTKSITIPVTFSSSDGVETLKSDVFKIDRSDFGVKYNSKKFFKNLKDKVIGDLMEFSFVIKQQK